MKQIQLAILRQSTVFSNTKYNYLVDRSSIWKDYITFLYIYLLGSLFNEDRLIFFFQRTTFIRNRVSNLTTAKNWGLKFWGPKKLKILQSRFSRHKFHYLYTFLQYFDIMIPSKGFLIILMIAWCTEYLV